MSSKAFNGFPPYHWKLSYSESYKVAHNKLQNSCDSDVEEVILYYLYMTAFPVIPTLTKMFSESQNFKLVEELYGKC